MAYTDYIRIFGLPENEQECFQGLGAAALYNAADAQPVSGGAAGATTTTTSEPADTLPQALWDTQTAVINRQSDFLMTISGTYAEKLANLPQQPSWWSVLADSLIEYTVGGIAEYLGSHFIGEAAEDAAAIVSRANVVRQVIAFLTEFAFNAWEYLKKYYNDSGKICMQMKEENNALAALTKSESNYLLRTSTLTQHEATIKNLIELIDALEKDMQNALPKDSMSALIQAIQDLRFNGASLQFPDGHVFTMVGATVTQETVLT